MLTLTLSLDSLSLYIALFDIAALLTYVLYIIHKKRKLENSIRKITDFISEYFINTGTDVQVSCYKLANDDKRFVVLIQSEPLKRFRYSFILESNLIAHTLKKTGSVVDKIYWRFPVSAQKDIIEDDLHIKSESEDLYFSEVKSKSELEYKVSEASWDDFEGSK
jgi:hypothetical protein